MNVVEEKNRRLAEWHETLSRTVICGSLRAWLRTQLAEVDAMRTDGLIDAGEARELHKLANAGYAADGSVKQAASHDRTLIQAEEGPLLHMISSIKA